MKFIPLNNILLEHYVHCFCRDGIEEIIFLYPDENYLEEYRYEGKINNNFYQNYARIYLDEYPEQKEERKDYFAKRWNLQNEAIKKVA